VTKLPAADASTHRQLLGLDLLDPCRGLLLPEPHPQYLDLLDRIGRALAHLVVRPSQAHEDIVLDCHRDFQGFWRLEPSQPGVFLGQMRRAGLGLPLPPNLGPLPLCVDPPRRSGCRSLRFLEGAGHHRRGHVAAAALRF